jgi:hypothetical protein
MSQLDGNVDAYKTECNRMLKYIIPRKYMKHVINSTISHLSFNGFCIHCKKIPSSAAGKYVHHL